ncbi:unnamed protein product [Prunus armeniaca]|uniref:Uncharacterized protein n=1 Tax=Prunus armeniaca TaxID=36596 RepID=A0A6J5X5F3_PRUAR|nr:unnamed protein product [Prunus armeniaca]
MMTHNPAPRSQTVQVYSITGVQSALAQAQETEQLHISFVILDSVRINRYVKIYRRIMKEEGIHDRVFVQVRYNLVSELRWDFNRLSSDVPFVCYKKVSTIEELQRVIEYNGPYPRPYVQIDYEETRPARRSVLRKMARANELEGVGSCLESSDEEYEEKHDEEDNDENDNNVDDDDNGGGEFNNGGSGLEGGAFFSGFCPHLPIMNGGFDFCCLGISVVVLEYLASSLSGLTLEYLAYLFDKPINHSVIF